MLTAKDLELKVIMVLDVDSLVEKEHAILRESPIQHRGIGELRGRNGVVWVSFTNVFGELLNIDYISP